MSRRGAGKDRPLGAIACVLFLVCIVSVNADASVKNAGYARALEISDWITNVRQELHKVPEIQYDLPKTSALVRKTLDGLGISYRYPVAKSGIVAEVGKGSPIVLLRADMDALPITEATGLPFSSTIPGNMHACGHDAHTAILLGAARILKERADNGTLPKGTVRFAFQPAEEGGAGGKAFVQEGVLEGVGAAFGIHVWPTERPSAVGLRVGPVLAGTGEFEIEIKGGSSHAALPHFGIDTVVAAASIVTTLQTIVARETDPFDSAAISVARLVAGVGQRQAYNVVPDTSSVGGTYRATQPSTVHRLRRRIKAVVDGVALAYGVNTTIDWREVVRAPYPPTVNDAGAIDLAKEGVIEIVGADEIIEAGQSLGGEDFAFFAERVPSAFVFLSQGPGAQVHTPFFRTNDTTLPVGSALHVDFATRYLERKGKGVGAGFKPVVGFEPIGTKDEL